MRMFACGLSALVAVACCMAGNGGGAPSEEYAREEFARYVTRMTGHDYAGPLEIVLDGKLGKEEFAVTKRDGRLSIRGGVRGVLYGVYDVLEKFGGVRWYSSWCEKVPKAERLVVPEGTDYSEKPAFWARLPYWIDVLKHPDFAARLRANGHLDEPLQPRHGGPAYCLDRKFGFSHTFNRLVPPEEFKDTHPEYFSEIGGKRLTERTQLCLTNPEVFDLVVRRLREAIAENPEANMYALAHNDYKNWCECAKCKAINDAAGNPGMTEFLFVNKVVTEIAKERPDILFKLSAYVYTRKPPKDIKLHPNVMVDLCPIEADLVFPLPESKCKDSIAFCRDMEGWSKVRGDNFFIFDYGTSFLNLLQILPNAYTAQGNALYYRSMGVNMVFNLGDYTGYHADFAELKAYLQAKWAWNPDLPAEPLVADFFEGYYGPAAPFVREFFDDIYARQRAHCADGTHFMTCYTPAAKELAVDGEFFRKSAALWARAKAAVRGDPTFEYNVKTSALSFLYTALCLNGKRYFLTAHPEEFGPETDAYRLAKTCVETMDEARRKRGGMVRLVEDIVRHKLRYAELENVVKSGPADKSVKKTLIIPAKDFGRSKAFVLTNDVARFDRGRYDWVTALGLGNLAYDKGVRYRLRMHVKVERSADMPDGIAFKGGYYDPANKVSFEKAFRASEASADWAWYEIGETEFGPRGLFWISSGTFDKKRNSVNPCVGAVYVDKVEISAVGGCPCERLCVRQEGSAVVLKAARAEIRVEDGRITRLSGPNGLTVNAGTSERTDRVGLGVMTDPWFVTLAHQPFVMPTIRRCNKEVAGAATMWRRPCEKSSLKVRETADGAVLVWRGLFDGKAFFPDDELSIAFGTDAKGAITMKTRGRSPKGGVFCVQTPVEDIAGANALVMPIMGGQRYRVDEMQKATWSATSDCMRYDAPLVAIETARGAFGLWSEDETFRNFAAYFPKQDETASFAFEFLNVMPFEPKTEAESPVVKLDAFPGCDWLGAATPYRDWYQKRFAAEIALRDGTWGDEINVMVTSSMDRYMLFDDHLDTLTNLFGKGILFNFFKMTQESSKTKKFDWELPGHTPDLDFLPSVRARHKRGIRCSCYMNAHCVNYNSTSFRRDRLDRIALPTLTNPYGYKPLDKQPKGTPEEKWKAMNLKDTALVYCDMNSKAWRDYNHKVHKACLDALELDTSYEDCIGVIRDVGNGETDGTTGSLGVYLHARDLQRKMPVPFLGEFGPAPVAMVEKFPLVSANAYQDELAFLNFRMHHSLPMSAYLFGYRPWGTGNEHERSEYHRFLGAALSDATGGLGFVTIPPWKMESGINDHMTLRAKVFADNALKPYFPENGRYPDGVVAMYRGKDGGLFRYTDDGKVQVMRGPDGKPLWGRVSLATEFDVPGLELPGWPMRKGSRHYGLKPENLYTLFPAKSSAANPFGDIPESEKLVLAYDTPEYTYLELAGKAPKITFKVKESKPMITRSVQMSTGLELKGDAVPLTNGAPSRVADGLTMYMVKPAGFRTLDFVHTVKPGEAFRVDTQNCEWGTQISNASRIEVLVNGIRQGGYDAAVKPNPCHENKFKRWLFDYRFHRYTVPLEKWVGQTVLLSVRIDEKGSSYDDRQRLALPKIVKYAGEPLEAIVPGMIPPRAWERFNGGEPPHEGDDVTYPKKSQKTEQGVKAVGELNNGL